MNFSILCSNMFFGTRNMKFEDVPSTKVHHFCIIKAHVCMVFMLFDQNVESSLY